MNILSNTTPPTVREVATKSIITLKVQQNKLEQASYRLKERDRILFETCMGALKKNNREKAAMCATELAEVRKLVKFLYNVQLAIERVMMRLETINELGDIVSDLKPALKMLQNVSSELFQVLPDIGSELNSVAETVQETLHAAKITSDPELIPVGRKTEGGEEILNEVTSFMEQKIAETLPEPPAASPVKEPVKEKTPIREMVALTATSSHIIGHKTTEETGFDPEKALFSYKKQEIKEFTVTVPSSQVLEDMVLQYVRKTNGEIDLSRCSSELQTSNSEIERALESLGTKGKIKIEMKSPE